MSKETERVVRIKAIDDTTPVLLGIARTIRAVSREIVIASRLFHALKEAELAAAAGALTVGLALRVAIPIFGLVAGLFSILAAFQITQERAAIPIGQTAPGEIRRIPFTMPILAHGGELAGAGWIGRPERVGFGGGDVVMHNTFIMSPLGQRPEEIARKLALDMKREFRSITSE